MKFIPSTIIPKVIFLFLYINYISCENVLNTKDITAFSSNYTLDAIIHLKVKSSCQTVTDCSEGALECRKDNNNENQSYCVYPDYICSSNEACYLLKKTTSITTNTSSSSTTTIKNSNNNTSLYPNNNSSNNNNTNNNVLMKEVLDQNNNDTSKKFVINTCIMNETNNNNNNNNNGNNKFNCTNTNNECSSDDDCLSSQCVSGICQVNIETFTYYCNAKTTGYLCRKIKDITKDEAKECDSIDDENNCSPSFSIYELKYVFISILTLSAIVLLMIGLWIFNAKSKPLVDDITDDEDFSVVIF